jgi:hypothetical protein
MRANKPDESDLDPSAKALEDSIFRVGKVIAVEGRTVRIKVDKAKNSSHLIYKGALLRNVSVGGYVKIAKGFTSLIGKVDGESVLEDREAGETGYASGHERIDRTLIVSLVGFWEGEIFRRGIKELPLIDNECYLIHEDEFSRIHDFLRNDETAITIGSLTIEKGMQISLGVDGLFASHVGIFGNTGSGKSYTLATLYHRLYERFGASANFTSNSEFFLIDFNGEYLDPDHPDIIVEGKFKQTYRLSTKDNDGQKFPVQADTLKSADFWIVLLEATEKTQKPFLNRALSNSYLAAQINSAETLKTYLATQILTVTSQDTRYLERGIVTSFLREIQDCLNDNASLGQLASDFRDNLKYNGKYGNYYYKTSEGKDIFPSTSEFKTDVVDTRVGKLDISVDWMTLIDRIRLIIVLQFYEDIFRGFSNREHLSGVIKRMDSRVHDLKKVIEVGEAPKGKNFTVVSLKDVNIHLRKILPLLLCKKLYDDKKHTDDGVGYLNIIIDEAHNILSYESNRESEQWKDYRIETFEEIIKEGRKFGVFLTLASQRPSDISPTIVSQLHNYFLHRLINEQDIKAIERTVSYLDRISFESLPILPVGTCIFGGLLANIPVLIDIDKLEDRFEPKSKTRALVKNWAE